MLIRNGDGVYIDLSRTSSPYFPVPHENASLNDDTAMAWLSLNDISMISFKHSNLVGVSIDVVLYPRPSIPSFHVPHTNTLLVVFIPRHIVLFRKISEFYFVKVLYGLS